MSKVLRIGTRDSQLAVWQATLVQDLLKQAGHASELVYMKSEGDVDTITPLYALGVTGVFTKTLDAALLNNRIDIAVHSMKDVPTQMAQGIREAAVLKRASAKDILVYKDDAFPERLGYTGKGWTDLSSVGSHTHHLTTSHTIATGSIRRIAQWRHRYPGDRTENLRGNVNTRLRKLQEHEWDGAIFAAAGLERIHLRPERSIDLDWMLPAPAQGAILIVCREEDDQAFTSCQHFHDRETALCTHIERSFLSALMGGCSTPISALAMVKESQVFFEGNIVAPDGSTKASVEKTIPVTEAGDLGIRAAREILLNGGQELVDQIRKTGLAADGQG
ncbi:MAG TPA: hydroxymethylbilane synthase [Flavisolibacter sp.]|jgi:hydroxymethylbilane synthase|nr:hydroxymethylbilane synthase [Flavisolibacter sp.]